MFRTLFCGLALFLVACGPPTRGALQPTGYTNNDYALKVDAVAEDELMPEGWVLDNYYVHESPSAGKSLKPKTTDEYTIEYELDFDGDGKTDSTAKEFVYELRFTHKKHDGRLFLRTIPLSTNQGEKRLSVLLNRYAEGVAGAGYELVKFGETSMVVEKRYAVAVKSQQETKLGESEALLARLEVANLDQIKIDPNARKEQVALLLVRTNFVYEQGNGTKGPKKFPVLLLASYANQPEEFDEGLKDFYGFLKRVAIDGRKGFAPPQEAVRASKADTELAPATVVGDEAGSPEQSAPSSVESSESGEAPAQDLPSPASPAAASEPGAGSEKK